MSHITFTLHNNIEVCKYIFPQIFISKFLILSNNPLGHILNETINDSIHM